MNKKEGAITNVPKNIKNVPKKGVETVSGLPKAFINKSFCRVQTRFFQKEPLVILINFASSNSLINCRKSAAAMG